jgi:hypothetical protein
MFIVKLLVLPINRSRIAEIMWDWVELLNIHDVREGQPDYIYISTFRESLKWVCVSPTDVSELRGQTAFGGTSCSPSGRKTTNP